MSSENPALAFVPDPQDDPGLDIRVNFGIFAGRQATGAEIDRLGEWLLDEVDAVTIIAEERHEIGNGAEASVQQIRIAVSDTRLSAHAEDRNELSLRLVERADYWARSCIVQRHGESSPL